MKTVLFIALISSVCFGGLVESVNRDFSPTGFVFIYYTEIGWEYNAKSSVPYYLNMVQTRFNNAGVGETWNREAILEIYTAPPSMGGQLLRNVSFTPEPDVLTGGSFEPLLINPGDIIFVGFRNIKGLGFNCIVPLSLDDWVWNNAEKLKTYSGDQELPDNMYEQTGLGDTGPILLFFGAPVPEPAGLLLLGLGGLMMRKRCSE